MSLEPSSHRSAAPASRGFMSHLRRLLTKPFQIARYKLAYRRHAERFLLDPAEFAGKRVLVLGPASTVTEELDHIDPADFDIIVRMNKAIDVPFIRKGVPSFRCEVLFHSFGTEGVRAAGEVTRAKLERAGTRIVVHRTSGKSLFLKTLEYERAFSDGAYPARLKIIPPSVYALMKGRLDEHSATTGTMAMVFFLKCDTACLGIAGFSFYTTRYIDGYQPEVQTDAEALTFAKHKNIHDPVLERALVAELYRKAVRGGKRIVLGHVLQDILDKTNP